MWLEEFDDVASVAMVVGVADQLSDEALTPVAVAAAGTIAVVAAVVDPPLAELVTAAAAVDKQMTAEWVLGEMVLGQRGEAIESAAEVRVPTCQQDMHIRRRCDHPRNPAITARNIATGVSRRIRTLPPDGRTTSIAAAP